MEREGQKVNNQKVVQNKKLENFISAAILIIGSLGVGFYTGHVSGSYEEKYGILGMIFVFALLILIFFAVTFLHVIAHEGGHLIFGLLSGYEFVSFRIGSIMFIKEDGRLKIKRFNIVGTGGQCLLMPDSNWNAYNFPYVLYNLGGSLLNLSLVLISFVIFMAFPSAGLLTHISFVSIVVGLIATLTNAIPMRIGGVANDGYNTLHLKKDKEAVRSLYMQLYVNGLQTRGKRLKDMPEEYFELPDNADLSNPLIVTIGVFKCMRLHDNMDFNKAKEYSDFLIENASGLLDIHKNELLCELLFYEIIGSNRQDEVERLYTKELANYIKNTSIYLSRRRLMYAYEVFVNNNKEAAKKELEAFNKLAKNYPYAGDLESERELIKFINDLALVKNIN
ncbi:MAG: hypothetical protein GX323_07945 [Clostridiales bacterium]|nr:hypothetical protein [Clostridiales bacterium]